MRKVNLTHFFICSHTPTPKQISISKSHKSPHISSSVWGTLTLSLIPYIFCCHVSTFLKECIHALHRPNAGSIVKGCLRERRKCFLLTHKFPLPFPSVSLVSFTLTLSLSLFHFAFSSLLLFTLPQCTQMLSMKEELTIWQRKSDITCTHDERENKMNEWWKKWIKVCEIEKGKKLWISEIR